MTNTAPILISDAAQSVQLADWASDFLSGESGLRMGKRLDDLIMKKPNQPISVSLQGISNASPSFINGAFVYLLELYGEDYFRQFVKIRNASPRVAQSISESLKGFIAHRQEFYKRFSTNSIYLIDDGSPMAQKALSDLWQANVEHVRFLGNDSSQILSASCAIGILTEQTRQKEFLEEVNLVLQYAKPVLILAEKNVPLTIPADIRDRVQKISFNADNLSITVRSINEYVKTQTVRRKEGSNTGSADILEVAAWTLLGLGAVYLATRIAKA
ncbi:MAG: STAS-like domain-containing protein [Saprospiraceae bacterium]